MTTPPYLGPRAAFLLGLLTGQPKTVAELAAIADRGIEVFEDRVVRNLADGGPDEIRRLLVRLERFGLARRVTVDEDELWLTRVLESVGSGRPLCPSPEE